MNRERLQLTGSARPGRLWLEWLFLGSRVSRERTLWLALLIGFAALGLAYQSPRPLVVDIGQEFDAPYTPGFYAPEENAQANFRWSAAHSTLFMPGAGKPLTSFPVRLQLSSGSRPGDNPLRVDVLVNGHPAPPLSVTRESASYIVMVDPSWVDLSGDLRLDFSSSTFKSGQDRRDLGFIADFAQVALPAGLVIPSVSQLAWLLLAAFLLYLIFRSVWLTPRAAGLLTLLFLLASAAIMAVQRLLLTVYTAQIAVTLVIALIIALLAEATLRSVVRLAGWRGERSLSEWTWVGLRGIVALSVALKVGGVLYPGSLIIDAPFHLKYITYMSEFFSGGRDWEQYFGKALAFSVMPKEEWGSARAFIPYSPFFYVVAAPLSWLPVPLAISVPVITAILDALKGALVFLIALPLGTGWRSGRSSRSAPAAALISVAVYSAIPATFLLQQFGNWPTQLSLWIVALWVAITCLFWDRYTTRFVWTASTAALTLAMLSYTVTAVYVGLFAGIAAVAGWIFAADLRRRWLALFLSTATAAALSLLIYYGHYIGDMLRETFPTFGKAIEEQGKLTTLRPTLFDFVTRHLAEAMRNYDLILVYGLGLAGTLWVFLRFGAHARHVAGSFGITARSRLMPRRTNGSRGTTDWTHVWLGAWLVTFPLFTLADFYVDQALKEFWFALPAIAVAAAAWLLALLRRTRGARPFSVLLWLLGAVLAWQSLSLWVFRLLFHNR